jgi:two-component system, OmpR family, phosphate regulon response regulator PhoB
MTKAAPKVRPRVLVVEDEAPLRELVVVTLGDAFACEEAEDGETALAALRAEPPELVILDVMLPGRSGLEILQEMRKEPPLEKVPVVVVSAWQTPKDVAAALAAGADRFLGKPFRVEELASMARALVGRTR